MILAEIIRQVAANLAFGGRKAAKKADGLAAQELTGEHLLPPGEKIGCGWDVPPDGGGQFFAHAREQVRLFARGGQVCDLFAFIHKVRSSTRLLYQPNCHLASPRKSFILR